MWRTTKILVCAMMLCIASIVAAPTASAGVIYCNEPFISSDGHFTNILCTGGDGTQYRYHAQACNSGSCSWLPSQWTNYGSGAYLSSTAYFTGNHYFTQR